jgi:DNA-binding transcriptional LysR family regulator
MRQLRNQPMVVAKAEDERRTVDLIDLDLVVAVADTGSITHGAARSHLSLPAASARIRDLERAVGANLFDRHRRGVTLTSAGTVLLHHARSIRNGMERMRHDLAEHADGHGATVRVWANTAAATSLLTPATMTYLTLHPDVRVDVEEHPSRQITGAVAEHRADLGLVSDSVDLGGLATQVLRPDPLVVVTTPGDPLSHRPTVSYTDVHDRAFVGLSTSGSFPLDARPIYRARLPDLEMVLHAVTLGIGIAILPRHSVTVWVDNGQVAVVEIEDRWARRNLLLCFTTEESLSAPAKALRDHLTTAAGGQPAARNT